MVAAAAMLTLKDGVCGNVRLGYRNVGETIFRLKAVEAQIEGQAPGQQLFSNAAKAAMKAVEPPSDLHADADYRRDLVMARPSACLAKPWNEHAINISIPSRTRGSTEEMSRESWRRY